MTESHDMSMGLSEEPIPTTLRPRKKPPVWLWAILGLWLLEVGACILGFGVYYMVVELPESRFAQIYEDPWQDKNVSGMHFAKAKDFIRARSTLLASTRTAENRQDPVPHYLLAELYNATYQSNEAIDAYRQVVRLGEESWFSRLAYRNFVTKAHAALAQLYYEQGQHGAVLAELDAIRDLGETDKPNLLQALRDRIENPDRADFHLLLGKELRHDLKLALAAQEMKAAERLSSSPQLRLDAVNFMKTQMPRVPRDLSPLVRYFSLAGETCQYQHENLDQAAEFYRKATRQMPDYEWGYNELAIIYREKKEYDKATASAMQAITLNPDFYNPYLTLGDIALDQDNYAQAIRHFESAQAIIQRLPDEEGLSLVANIENQIGYSYESMNQPQEAARHYQKAMVACADAEEEDTSEDYDYAQDGLSRTAKPQPTDS